MIKIAVTGSICSGKSYVCKLISKYYSIPLFSSDEAIKNIYTDLHFLKEIELLFGDKIFINNQNLNNFNKQRLIFLSCTILNKLKAFFSSLQHKFCSVKTKNNALQVKRNTQTSFYLIKQIARLRAFYGLRFKNLQNNHCNIKYKETLPSKQIKIINKEYIINNIITNPQKQKQLERLLYKYLARERNKWINKNKKFHSSLLFEVPLLFEKKLQTNYNITICITASSKTRVNLAKKRGLNPSYLKTMLQKQMPQAIKQQVADFCINNAFYF